MKCLYIDTSSNFLYSAISNNGKLLTSTSEELDHDLSKITLVKISNMFKEINMKPQDIDKIIVVNVLVLLLVLELESRLQKFMLGV